MKLRLKFISASKIGFYRFRSLFTSLPQTVELDLSEVSLSYYESTASALVDFEADCIDGFIYYSDQSESGLSEVRKIRLHKDFLFAPVIVVTKDPSLVSGKDYIRHGVQDYFLESELTVDRLKEALKNILGKVRIWGSIKAQQRKKNDQLAVVSHDIKSPLTIIKSYMDILLSDSSYNLSEEAKAKVLRSRHNAQLALDLVVDILDEFRSKKNIRLNFEKISCSELLNEVVSNLSHIASKKNIQILMELEEDFELFADKKSMAQLFTNLLDNAIKYSKPNSKVRVKGRSYLSMVEKKQMAYIIVSDEGVGVDPDKLELIFSPYQQANDADFEKGHGLGLSICRRICQYHMGKVWASNRLNGGTSFNVLLPRYQNSNKVKNQKDIVPKLNVGVETGKYRISERKCILVVDDSKDIREITKKKLVGLGFEVSTARDGVEAMEVFRSSTPDLVLLDLNMPVMSGDEFLLELSKSKIRKCPVFLYSILKSEAIFISSLKRADGFIQKPLQIEEFISKTSIYMSWKYLAKKKSKTQSVKSKGQIIKAEKEPGKVAKVLIVDDCKDNHEIIKYYFYKNGHVFDSAFSGEDCLKKIQDEKFDLILMDLNMPKMNGFQVAKEIQKSSLPGKKTPMVAFSADDMKFKEFRDSSELFSGFLKKPINPDDLAKVVDTLCFG